MRWLGAHDGIQNIHFTTGCSQIRSDASVGRSLLAIHSCLHLGKPNCCPKSDKLLWKRWRWGSESLSQNKLVPLNLACHILKAGANQTNLCYKQTNETINTHTTQHNTNEGKHYHIYFLNFHKVNELQISVERWSLHAGMEKATILLSIREH